MAEDVPTRPCWVVLAPGRRSTLERRIVEVWAASMGDDPCTWEIRNGRAGYVAVIEYDPGSECVRDEDLGRALSRDTDEPAYVLWLHEDGWRVQVFIRGEHAGDVSACPDDVAAQLGCSFPLMSASTVPVDLTPRKTPAARPGELKIAGWTAAQWAHEMEHDIDWSVLLDPAGPAEIKQVVEALTHPSPIVRRVACRLVETLGLHRMGARNTEEAISQLQSLADRDPDEATRAAAQQTIRELAERVVPGFD